MLAARRDPPFHSGAHEGSHLSGSHYPHAAHAPHAALGVARFMTALQVIGSLLAIPVGLASGYSIYHANFSPEANCQSLRAGIISMLDKNADASTLRLLVRRDVAAFEGACGAVDPDAVAAFKTLLTSGKPAPPAASSSVVPVKEAAREPARSTNVSVKPAIAKALPAIVELKPSQRDADSSDANWVASVRRALVHAPVTRAEAAPALATRPAPAAALPLAPKMRISRETPAPALPPAAAVAVVSRPAPDDAHPVPPASIPEAMPLPKAADTAPAERHSGFFGLLAQFPLLGRVVGH
jgi:hypothetical protein